MNNLEILFELAEAKHELELLIDNTLSNLTPYETQLVLKEGLGKNIARGLVGVGLYKYGKSRGNKQGTEQGMIQGKRTGRREGIYAGSESGMETQQKITSDVNEYNKLSNKAKRGLNRILGKPSAPFNKTYRSDIKFNDDPTVYNDEYRVYGSKR